MAAAFALLKDPPLARVACSIADCASTNWFFHFVHIFSALGSLYHYSHAARKMLSSKTELVAMATIHSFGMGSDACTAFFFLIQRIFPYSVTQEYPLQRFILACWRSTAPIFSNPPLFVARWLVMSRGGDLVVIYVRIFQTPHPRVINVPKDEGTGTTLGGPEEEFTEELCRPFVFGLHAIVCNGVGRNRRVICLEQHVKAIEGAADVGCLVVDLDGNEAFVIGALWDVDGLQEVAEEIT